MWFFTFHGCSRSVTSTSTGKQLPCITVCFARTFPTTDLLLQVKALQKQLESETERRTSLASDLQSQVSELSLIRTREKLLLRDLEEAKEARSSLEEELHKLETQRSVDELQMKELNDTLEAEQYFSVSSSLCIYILMFSVTIIS